MGNEQLVAVDPTQLKVGTILRLGNMTIITPNRAQLGYNAGKDKVFIGILLGTETRYNNKDGIVFDEIDIKKAMNRMGWYDGISIDWVECAQFLMGYKSWPGDERDFARVISNMSHWGMPPEMVKELEDTVEWCVDNKQKAWDKVYIKFKQMYRKAFDMQALSDELPPKIESPKKSKKKPKK